MLAVAFPAVGAVLWSHPETVLVCDNGKGEDILHGAVKPRDRNSAGTLYFRIKVTPISDTAAKMIKPFEAGFMLVENGVEHLGIGNTDGAMAFSALNVPTAPRKFQDFNSSVPDAPFSYEYMRAGVPRYIVWRVEYVPGQDAKVTAWLNPDLSHGMTEFNQPTNIVVHFQADATFDEFRLIHRGYGGGWKFSQMMVATSFEDLLMPHFWQRGWFVGLMMGGLLSGVAVVARLGERRRAQRQIRRLEQESAVAAERARIARDIHDEVGASLTKIGKLTELMDWKNKGEADQAAFTRSIADTARETIRAMDEIVWAINPKNDTLKEMADYFVYYAQEFLRPTGISCELDVPLEVPVIPLTAEVRHHLFMVVKEALHNAVKHAAPRRIKLALEFPARNRLSIVVSDDGCGFRPDQAAAVGNGLENMDRRMRDLGGGLQVCSQLNQGTTVTLQLSLASAP
ncbi:MAG TPA: sensor histidine kinase [Verrucomicrobiae bacterium]|nr:sensor histidine kinase [Verrucomicrobiae bacterium]